MKVLVCGSRYFNDYDRLEAVLSNISGISEIIHGGANGADLLGERYARQNSIPIRRFPAEWSKFGKSAGPIRNRQMLRDGAPDLVVAFLAPNSRGTKDMIDVATKAGVPVEIIDIGNLEKLMEEMAAAPREGMGIRQPGEKCSYEKPLKGHST
jgi:hypothetical protein